MRGKADGSHVWFDPIGVHVQPGQTVRWTNRDPGNSHTVTVLPSRDFRTAAAYPDRSQAMEFRLPAAERVAFPNLHGRRRL